MRLDLKDPQSIADWYRIAPQRHAAILRYWLRSPMHAAFRQAIEAARDLVSGKR